MKRKIEGSLIACILLLAVSCTKETINTTAPATAIAADNSQIKSGDEFYLGQRYGGGVIFWLDSTGQHGLITDTIDIKLSSYGLYIWGDYGISGAKGRDIGTGRKNTNKILQFLGYNGNYAAYLCAIHEGSGYKDWYLPSKNELHEIYLKSESGILKINRYWQANYYWSSTETDDGNSAWSEYMTKGLQEKISKFNNDLAVRAIRTF